MGIKEDFTTWHYYNGKCYGWISSKKSWSSAQSNCISLGGYLTKMESQGEMEFLKGKFGGKRFWTGASDVITEGTWLWSDGSPVSWTYWDWPNPDGGGSENCAMWHNSLEGWVDAPCYYSRYSVCSMKVSQDLALRIETIFLISTDCVLCRIVTGNQSPTPAVPPRSRADCGEETATLTATVLVI